MRQLLGVPFSDNVKYTITSPFGSRDSPVGLGGEVHTGIDLSAPARTEVVASASGYVISYKVTVAQENQLLLNMILGGLNIELSIIICYKDR